MSLPTIKDIANTIDIEGYNVAALYNHIDTNRKKVKINWGKYGVIENGEVIKTYKTLPFSTKELISTLSDYLEQDVEHEYLTEQQIEKIRYMKGKKEKSLSDGRVWKEGAVPFPDSIERYARCITPSDQSLNRSTHIIFDGKGYRKLTINERKWLMGLPKTFEFPVSKSQAGLQLGNGVVVDVIRDIAIREIT